MANIKIGITENGTTTLATAGKYCDRNIDVEVEVAGSGGGGEPDIEPIVLSGTVSYECSGQLGAAYLKLYGDSVSTNNISNANYMFNGNTTIEYIPFELNFSSGEASAAYIFTGCSNLKEVPRFNNFKPTTITNMFRNCAALTTIPEDLIDNWDFSYLHTKTAANMSYLFSGCYALRTIPTNFLKELWGIQTSSTYMPYNNAFNCCYCLDEIIGLGVSTATLTSNRFSDTFRFNYRLKDFTFDTNEDGTPKTVSWKSQTIELLCAGSYTGGSNNGLTPYGMSREKKIIDDSTYEELKDDPDAWTDNKAYARYNRESAVRTIESLPDTSAYGTNTIKFTGDCGSATDGGAINTMSEEEIAVAAAKGWTVSFS